MVSALRDNAWEVALGPNLVGRRFDPTKEHAVLHVRCQTAVSTRISWLELCAWKEFPSPLSQPSDGVAATASSQNLFIFDCFTSQFLEQRGF